MTPLEDNIARHYEQPNLLERLFLQAGLDPTEAMLSVDALGGLDEFHTGGARATEYAFSLLQLSKESRVLDVGCGIGGTARRIASRYGCRVSGIDITEDYVRIANELTERMELADACNFQHSSALNLGFADGHFDATVSFHVAMNIESRGDLYREIHRVTKPNGCFLSYDLVQGPNSRNLDFPLPWSGVPEDSFLKTAEETSELMQTAGFEVTGQHPLPAAESPQQQRKSTRPPNPLLGEGSEQKIHNHQAAIADQRIVPLFFVAMARPR